METHDEPRTLAEAQAAVETMRPTPREAPAAWIAWHEAAARLFETVSDVDRFSHHEALYWASYSHRQAKRLAEEANGTDAEL